MPDVRLVDGGSRCAGRSEIKHQEEWRRPNSGYKWNMKQAAVVCRQLDCGSTWSIKHAAIVCRQLDCGSAVSTKVYDGDVDRPAWWLESDCAGTESALGECGYVSEGFNTSSIVEVICSGNTHNVVTFTWGSWSSNQVTISVSTF